MALKDWKLYHKNPSITTWIKKKDDYGLNPHFNGTIISVEINSDWDWNKKKLSKGGYDVEINTQGFNQSRKWFKTKSEALTYAKKFMRTY
jgi:hypothetical protein